MSQLLLRDGSSVTLHPVSPIDRDELRAAIDAADEDTLYHRFFTARPKLHEADLDRLTTVDQRSRAAFVAREPAGRGVAVARYEPDTDGAAEVAVVVDPSWRRRGLAGALLRILGETAIDSGYDRLRAYALAENRAIAAVLAREGYEVTDRTGPLVTWERPTGGYLG